MQLEFALLRHGRESGERLCGIEDRPLRETDKRIVKKRATRGDYPEVELVFSSGLSRCLETAHIIYPRLPVVVIKELLAPNMGVFEGKTVAELKGSVAFAEWAASAEAGAYPGGESPYMVCARAVAAFRLISREMLSKGLLRVAVVSHRAILVSIMQRFYVPRNKYMDWHIPYGGGYLLRYDTFLSNLEIISKI